jgi:hypothetical protein
MVNKEFSCMHNLVGVKVVHEKENAKTSQNNELPGICALRLQP